MAHYRIFDGHNDVMSRIWAQADRSPARFWQAQEGVHLDLPKAQAGGLSGGFFAIWIGADPDFVAPDPLATRRAFDPINKVRAREETLGMAALLLRMAEERPQDLRVCRSVAEIAAAEEAGAMAAIFHIEGCEGISEGLDELYLYHAAGLRSLGPVWSRDNHFGAGVPFDFPHSPDTGPGLTEAGKALLKACNRLGILFDLSHLNEAGFRDVAALSEAPLVATHSGVHALCPSTRNLTDWQLGAIAESRGLVGLNFGVSFLREDGVKNPDTAPQVVLRHLDYLVARLGEDGVALGSDFDGTMVPAFIGSAAGLPALVGAMEAAGYGDSLIRKICHDNWMNVLARTIG